MAKSLQSLRGMRDILPAETPLWQAFEQTVQQLFRQYGYREIRTPLLEATGLFNRAVGEVTDIVEKEMYTFEDRNGDSISLRPENTASCVRAGIENGLLHNQQQRMWYCGPMFRHERPQKGRYRQFHQVGAEVFGIPSADADAELIALTAELWRRLGIHATLEINTLGSNECRASYRQHLVDYLSQHASELDEDSKRRLSSNPLRILDSKNPAMADLLSAAPKLLDHLDETSQQHFDDLREYLDNLSIAYTINPKLVRGLDYYCHTVFEWVTTDLGAQGTICAGGRYDGLVALLGGRATPGTGFAMGIERILALMEQQSGTLSLAPLDCYVVCADPVALKQGMLWAETWRQRDQLAVQLNVGGGSLKSQLKRADQSGARYAVIIGPEELSSDSISLKPLRGQGEQTQCLATELANNI